MNKSRLSGGVLTVLLLISCTRDTDIALTNCAPSCVNMTSISRTLFFPESTVCTLLVKDLNDKRFSCSILQDPSISHSPGNIQEWPGTFKLLNETFGTKSILLTINPKKPGNYNGVLLIDDNHNAFTSLPYTITAQFYESFDSRPLLYHNWQLYNSNDSSTVKIDYPDKKLLFIFDTTQSSLCNTTGIISRFKLAGDFRISIDFRIRDDMIDGFETGFFVSTSNDTGKWSGDIAGIYLQGNQNHIRMECKSVNLQSFSKEVGIFNGNLCISRDNRNITFCYHDGNPLQNPIPIARFTGSPEDTVFIHIKMTVKDRKRLRHSLWNDFYITKGTIIPNIN